MFVNLFFFLFYKINVILYYNNYLSYDIDKVMCDVSSADRIISNAKELDIIQIDDMDEDMKNEFNKMYAKFQELKK